MKNKIKYFGVFTVQRVGRTFDDLINNSIDPSVFEDLTEDMMVDIISNITETREINNIEGIDPQFLESLPLEIRREIYQQYVQPSQAQPQQQSDLDQLIALINQTPYDDREEMYLQISAEQVRNLPQDLRQEATYIRDRADQRAIEQTERQLYSNQIQHLLYYQVDPQQQHQRNPNQQPQQQRKENQKSLNLKSLLQTQRHLVQKLGNVDDEFAESLLRLLYVESHSFVNFPINLFIALTNNPNVEYKLIDALFFILKNHNHRADQSEFPPSILIRRNGLIRDQSKIYQIVSLKILYLISKLQGPSIKYFFETKKQGQLQSIARLSESTQDLPLLQLIQLLPLFKGDHQELLIQAISNITTKQKDFKQDQLNLDSKSVECVCTILLQNMNRSVKNFSHIILNLSNNKENQQLIIKYIKEFIQRITREINNNFAKQCQYDEIFTADKALINVFQFVREMNDKIGENNDQQDTRSNFKELLEDQGLIQLWRNLIKLLQDIPQQKLAKLSTKISPYLECFFIIYQLVNPIRKNKNIQREPTKIASMEGQQQEVQEQQLHDELFQQICESGKVLLNMMIRERMQEVREKGKLVNDSLGVIIFKNPRIVDFDNKQKYFKIELKQLKMQNNRHHYGNINIRCRRKDIFMDSYHRISKLKPEELKGKLHVEFDGEEGIDAGGVTREWFLMLSKEIFNPNYALFTPSLNGQMFQPSNKSHVNPDHVKYFKFIGRIVGKALYDGQLLDTYFTRSFYKHILGQKLTIHDMEDIDLNEYNSMKKILEQNVTDWGINWTYNVDHFGKLEERELIEGGKTKLVTEENKVEYVQTYCYQKMAKEIKDQIEAFLNGFHELIPQSLVSIFEWKEMELMLCGLPDIDLEDMKENIEYHGYDKGDKVIQWIWELLESFDKSKRAAFLQFVTGTSKVPLGGFKELKGMHGPQKIQIHKKPYVNFELPTSHTCFNQLDLPDYPARQILKEKLELAIMEGKEGFGFA